MHAVSHLLCLCSQGTTLILWVPLIVMSVVELAVSGRCWVVSIAFIRRKTRIHCETSPVCNTVEYVTNHVQLAHDPPYVSAWLSNLFLQHDQRKHIAHWFYSHVRFFTVS